MTLSKTAQSTKNATTPTIQTTNNSVTILHRFWRKGKKLFPIFGTYINIRCEKNVARFKKSTIFASST